MTSTAVKNSFFQTAVPAGRVQKPGDSNQNFGNVFVAAGKNLQQSGIQGVQKQQLADRQKKLDKETNKLSQTEKKPEVIEKTKNTGKAESIGETENTEESGGIETAEYEEVVENAGKLENTEDAEIIEAMKAANEIQAATQEPALTNEALAEEVNNVVKQIIDKLKKILGISDEELMSAMESLGIQPFDLLNSELMSDILSAATGKAAISLVTDESMYMALDEMIGTVDEAVAELMDSIGVDEAGIDVVLGQLKEFMSDADNSEAETQMNILLEAASKFDTDINKSVIQASATESEAEGGSAKEPVPENIAEDKLSDASADVGGVTDTDVQAASDSRIVPDSQTVVMDSKLEADSQMKPGSQAMSDNQTASKNGETALFTVSEKRQHGDKESHAEAKNYENQSNSFEQSSQAKLDNPMEVGTEIRPQNYISESTYDIIRQLADTVKIMKAEQFTQMEMQLHPASLGTVNVSLTTKGGMVTAEFITQNESVKAAIEAQAVQLRENLEQQGVKVEAIEVSVASHQMEKNLDQNGQEQRSAERQETQRIQGLRRRSINFNSFENGDELADEYDGADDATRIAMEMMSMNGASMDLLA